MCVVCMCAWYVWCSKLTMVKMLVTVKTETGLQIMTFNIMDNLSTHSELSFFVYYKRNNYPKDEQPTSDTLKGTLSFHLLLIY